MNDTEKKIAELIFAGIALHGLIASGKSADPNLVAAAFHVGKDMAHEAEKRGLLKAINQPR